MSSNFVMVKYYPNPCFSSHAVIQSIFLLKLRNILHNTLRTYFTNPSFSSLAEIPPLFLPNFFIRSGILKPEINNLLSSSSCSLFHGLYAFGCFSLISANPFLIPLLRGDACVGVDKFPTFPPQATTKSSCIFFKSFSRILPKTCTASCDLFLKSISFFKISGCTLSACSFMPSK